MFNENWRIKEDFSEKNKEMKKEIEKKEKKMKILEENIKVLMEQLKSEEEVRITNVEKIKFLKKVNLSMHKKWKTSEENRIAGNGENRIAKIIDSKIQKIVENRKSKGTIDDLPNIIICEKCNIEIGKKSLVDHLKGKKHRKKVLYNLNIEFLKVTKSSPLCCEYCNSTHTSKKSFIDHLQSEGHHKNELNRYIFHFNGNGEDVWSCLECGKVFNSEKKLKDHYESNFESHFKIIEESKLSQRQFGGGINSSFQLKKQKERSIECIICLEKERNILFQHCNHCCCCLDCSNNIQQCPICRKEITKKVKIYL